MAKPPVPLGLVWVSTLLILNFGQQLPQDNQQIYALSLSSAVLKSCNIWLKVSPDMPLIRQEIDFCSGHNRRGGLPLQEVGYADPRALTGLFAVKQM